jgi:hypothetical protein
MGISVSLTVILMHLQIIRCKRILYSIFHEKKKCLVVWKIQISSNYGEVSFSAYFSWIPSAYVLHCKVRDQALNPYKTAGKIIFLLVHFNLYVFG